MFDIDHLIKLCNDESIRVPSGLDRYERRKVMKQLYNERRNKMSKFILSVESCLDWDDSEQRTEVLGVFDYEDRESLTKLVDSYWEYEGQEQMTDEVVDGVLASLNPEDIDDWGRFTMIEKSDEYYKHRYTFELKGTGE